MKQTAYGKPILLNSDGSITELEKIKVLKESSIQELIFQYPSCLPISDIDESYNPIIPVCIELRTPVGPLDILMITPDGEIAIIETKLWRNPEARRVVVAQILDYAKELSKWSYEDLQREVNRNLERKGNTLYKIAQEYNPNLVPLESDFVDSVSRNLARGKFLLLIAGDGIREGAKAIAEFLSSAAYLNFTFAMVELNLYKGDGIGQLIIPQTLAQTVKLPKLVVEIPEGLRISREEDEDSLLQQSSKELSIERQREKQFFIKFWLEFVKELTLDDPGQSIPNPAKGHNLYVYPANSKKAWISAYFSKSSNRVGVYFRTQNDPEGIAINEYLDEFKVDIREELGNEVIWKWEESNDIGVRFPLEDVYDPASRESIKEFFQIWINRFVNALRPRLKRMDTL